MRLRLKGFKGVKAGPQLTWNGLDEIEIDFNNVSGLTAFEGECGSGKSTVMECLHHYPQLVSRDGALWQHVFLRDSEKEFESEFMGHHYRSLIKLDAQSEKSEGFMWVDGKPVVNGKISAYKKYVEGVFGTPFTYFRSQFCPQKSRKTKDMQIENMTAGIFKELLREFLNIQKYITWEDGAKQAANIYTIKAGEIETRITALREKLAGIDQTKEEIKKSNDHLISLSADQDCKKGELLSHRSEVDNLKKRITQNTLALQRKADITANIERLQTELGKEKTVAEAEIEALKDKYRDLQIQVTKHNSILKDRDAIVGAADREREINQNLEKANQEAERIAAEISKHTETIHELDRITQSIDQNVRDLVNDPEFNSLNNQLTQIGTELLTIEQQVKDIDNDKLVFELKNKITTCQEKMAALDLKDTSCQSTSCAFIVSALEASKMLPAFEIELTHRLDQLLKSRIEVIEKINVLKTYRIEIKQERNVRIADIEKTLTYLSEKKTAKEQELKAEKAVRLTKEDLLTDIRQNICQARLELEKAKELAEKKAEVQIAEIRKSDLEKTIQDITLQGKTLVDAWTEKETARKTDIDELMAKLNLIEAEIDTQAEGKLSVMSGYIETIEQIELPGIEKSILGAREKIAALQSDLSKMADAEKELEESTHEKELLIRNASEWKYLQAGCGKNGLQAMEIDGAAPLIVEHANKLLSTAYNSLYSIRLATIDESGKEDLSVKIIMENGEEIFLDDISGGQRVWTVQALWLAMSLLNKEKSQRQFSYFCADEQDGALDADNARNFAALYRSFLELGKFQDIFFISHRPEVRSMAQNVLKFEQGKAPCWH